MSYSLEYDSKNKSLGRGSYNKQETRKTGLRLDEHKDEIKQSDWDNIVCVHQGIRLVCTINACGNFGIIGYSTGHVDLYNLQSGLYRGTYGENSAHECSKAWLVMR